MRTVEGIACPRGVAKEMHEAQLLHDIVYRPGAFGNWGHVLACVTDEVLAALPAAYWHEADAFPCDCVYPTGSRYDPVEGQGEPHAD